MRRGALAALALIGCAGGPMGAGAGLGVPVAAIRPDDRVVLRDMTTIQAIASSFDRVYVVTRSAVGTFRPLAKRWEPPVAAPAPEALQRVFAAIVDPLDQSLWLADPDALLHFDPLGERWERLPLPARVRALATDPARPDGIWVLTASGWYLQPRIGAARPGAPSDRVQRAPTLEDAFAALPQLRSMAPALSLGPGLQPGRLTAAAPDPSSTGWFLGTDLLGVLYLRPGEVMPESLRQGLPGDQVGAVVGVPGGVWVATDNSFGRQPAGLTFLSDDLAQTVPVAGDPAFGLGVEAMRDILPGERVLWLGTDRGVVRVGLDDDRLDRWDANRGLPDARVLSLAHWRGGVAVGMVRGLALIGANGAVTRPIDPVLDRVYDLHPRHDTLWVATDRGLAMVAPAEATLGRPAGLPGELAGGGPVLGVGSVGDTVVAMTADRLVWRDPVTMAWTVSPTLIGTTGVLRAISISPSGVWIGGDRGAALVGATGVPIAVLRVGVELPERVTALTVEGGFLWVGTLDGLVRIRLQR
ncbi:MAG: hypothetical protein KC544_06675 [Gemmatimonadetes bacterium]|nr:hypothetical protein [Gemmatimonadota bacterium]